MGWTLLRNRKTPPEATLVGGLIAAKRQKVKQMRALLDG
jgi:hypothetical protein